MTAARPMIAARKYNRIIIHFDYDCFYASVFEAETPALRSLPLAVQQKNIIVTCNYEARRRGLRKLQLISEAKKVCPDVVIVVGEELGKFRDVSKALYGYLKAFSWNRKVEKLGFDEVFMDVTDMVAYNQALLNENDLSHAFFHLSREDPTVGFPFDATEVAGHLYPDGPTTQPALLIASTNDYDLATRLILGSHLAQHIRLGLEENKGYTSTVGISTTKLLAKLVGNLHKPKNQTTLMPPYEAVLATADGNIRRESNVTTFIDSHDIGKIPGIGFKMSRKIRNYVLSNPSKADGATMYDEIQESVSVGDVRLYPGMGPELLEELLGGPGAERSIGVKTWHLINGIDDSDVKEARMIPSQISIEDSYTCLDTVSQVYGELRVLATSLLKRMHIDLLCDVDDKYAGGLNKRWIAYPKTIRLSSRPRNPLNADSSRTRAVNRISRSGPLPNFIFNLREGIDVLVSKLVQETLIPMFHRLHPAKQNWNISLINIAVTNMVETASEDGSGGGRDIGLMFKRQDEVLKEWRVEDKDTPPESVLGQTTGDHEESHSEVLIEPSVSDEAPEVFLNCPEDTTELTQSSGDEMPWYENGSENEVIHQCRQCGAIMPAFAMAAHERYHALDETPTYGPLEPRGHRTKGDLM